MLLKIITVGSFAQNIKSTGESPAQPYKQRGGGGGVGRGGGKDERPDDYRERERL